jgi:hypothetical protein
MPKNAARDNHRPAELTPAPVIFEIQATKWKEKDGYLLVIGIEAFVCAAVEVSRDFAQRKPGQRDQQRHKHRECDAPWNIDGLNVL